MSVLKFIRGIVLVGILSVWVLLLNASQMLSVVIYPFSKRLFLRYNMFCKFAFCASSAVVAYWCGNTLVMTGDKPRRENAVVMANHQAMVDIIALCMMALPIHTIGWMKWFVKDEFKYVPGPGWGLKFVNALFVKRDWAKDQDGIKALFRKYIEADIPFWIMIFPDGTRLTPTKLASSRAYAKKSGLPDLEYVLLPRPKGVWATIQGLQSKFSAVYDVTICYEGAAPTLKQLFCVGGLRIHIDIKRFELASLPREETAFNQWLLARFVEKNEWIRATKAKHGS